MKARPRLAIPHLIGASADIQSIVDACVGFADPVLIFPSDRPGSDFLADAYRDIAECASVPWKGLVEFIRNGSFDAVATFSDELVHLVDEARDGPDPFERWNKFAQRLRLNAVGASSLVVLREWSELIERRAEFTSGAVLKPIRGSTGAGIEVLPGPISAFDARQLLASKVGAPGDWFLEEQMDDARHPVDPRLAPYVSVDTASVGGRRHHFCVLDKLPQAHTIVETGHIYPSSLTGKHLRDVLKVVERALDGLHVENQVTHSEVRFTTSGPQVLEVNGRLGGFVEGFARRGGGLQPVEAVVRAAMGVPLATPPPTHGGVHLALLVPLFASDDQLARTAMKALREVAGVDAVQLAQPPSPLIGLRRVVAWTRARSLDDLFHVARESIDKLAEIEKLQSHLDLEWSRAVTRAAPALENDARPA